MDITIFCLHYKPTWNHNHFLTINIDKFSTFLFTSPLATVLKDTYEGSTIESQKRFYSKQTKKSSNFNQFKQKNMNQLKTPAQLQTILSMLKPDSEFSEKNINLQELFISCYSIFMLFLTIGTFSMFILKVAGEPKVLNYFLIKIDTR